MNIYNRKKFLQLSAGLAGSIALSPALNNLLTDDPRKLKTFGLQLYTLRSDLLHDPAEVLKQVAAFGYTQIESYEGPKGMFWGMSNIEFKKLMDDLGMVIISSHCDINKDFQKKVDDAAAIGMKYLIYNWPEKHESMDEYKRKATLFNQCGEICKKSGLRFANHNYDKSFELLDEQYPQDVLMAQTDPNLVDYQMDFYWAVVAGADPELWLKKYPDRFRLCHIKDRIKGTTERDASCNLGDGSIDFVKILKTAKKNGMQYYFVEQERYDGTTPLKAVEAGAEYMRKLRI